MSEQVNWQEFDKLHVIRRLRQLVAKWWRVQINFTDAKGFLSGVPKGKFFNPINEVCVGITAERAGFKACLSSVQAQTMAKAKESKNLLASCHAGFSCVSVPIRVGNNYLGSVFADGFLLQETVSLQKKQVKQTLETYFKDPKALQAYVDTLPVLSSQDLSYLIELIEMVVAEILIVQSNLYEATARLDELKIELGQRFSFQNMIGKSQVMQLLYRQIEKISDYDSLVLIQGENGTGKELIAKALHYSSKRADKKFVAVNCGAFNDNLLESELFGHVKGAFTGAIKDKMGLFAAANGGTLFLDEIGDTSHAMQVKLLRVLQEGTYMPVGGVSLEQSLARVVCATNKDLASMVKDGSFREDLFYRLNVINLHVPALRQRREDIPLLVEYFLEKNNKGKVKKAIKLSHACMNLLLDHLWPGNIRELENEIERLWVLSDEEAEIKEDFLSPRIRFAGEISPSLNLLAVGTLKEAVEELEKKMILDGLKRLGWNKTKLAKELGVSRAGLIMKVEKYGFEKRS